ncbi:uncharacterized protein FTOL_04474 [Fusarium torulosum]|uniref:FAD dependent oxidoreductase domain-containing protein n=1 Tax=Fusarium torulosum TaxID=33205 RepID=A0AAE8SG53_9HYPO|nr:uncharacterized protein FTOL_04474 [Fusarium torulosum]
MATIFPEKRHNYTNGRAGPPSSNSTRSYWHRDPSKQLLGHRTTDALPSTADVVIIGSGITGTFAARELVGGHQKIVMLEAREACWGATGRNGGHCQPAVWDAPADVARFELATYNIIADLVAKHNIPCDWQVIGGVHPIFTADVLDIAKKQIKRLKKHPDLKDKAFLIQDKEELSRIHTPHAMAAVYQPQAAKCWPYKLVTWLLESLLSERDASEFNLQTNTVVQRLHHDGSSWNVHTERGQIQCRHVLLATNAYTSHLIPEMTGLIIPVRGQVCALEPPEGTMQLPHSYCWMKGADHQYLIQRGLEDTQLSNGRGSTNAGDRSLIFGGERLAERLDGEEGLSNDDNINPAISEALHKCIGDALKLPMEKEEVDIPKIESQALKASYEWTGIMGYSSDGGAWVGQVSRSLLGNLVKETNGEADVGGLWVAAGFTGHGMPVAARCGIAIAEMILGKEGGVEVPTAWRISEERIKAARGLRIPQTLDELLKEMPAE